MMFLSSRKFTVISRHALARLHEYASEEHLGKIGAKTRYVMNPRSGFSLGSAGHWCMSLPYGGVSGLRSGRATRSQAARCAFMRLISPGFSSLRAILRS